MPDVIRELLLTVAAIRKRLLVGCTDGARTLTLVIERTLEPSSWLVISGWSATKRERKMLGT